MIIYKEVDLGYSLQGDYGEIVSLNEQTSPYFQLKEKRKCIEYKIIGQSEIQVQTSPKIS